MAPKLTESKSSVPSILEPSLIKAVTITEELFETDPDDPDSKISGYIEAVSIKEEFEIVEETFGNLPVKVNEKTIMNSIENFDQEGEWKKQIKPCYVKLVDIEFSQILKKKQRKKHESIPTGAQVIGRLFSPSQKLKKWTHPFWQCFELGMGILNVPRKIFLAVYEPILKLQGLEGVGFQGKNCLTKMVSNFSKIDCGFR